MWLLCYSTAIPVNPAQAGIHSLKPCPLRRVLIDSRLRGNDREVGGMTEEWVGNNREVVGIEVSWGDPGESRGMPNTTRSNLNKPVELSRLIVG